MSARKPFRCFGIGEILWDLLPSGMQLGGAPANFAWHARALGMDASVVSRVGNDPLGREIQARLADLGLSTAHIQVDDSAPTGTVEVKLTGNGVPQYVIRQNVAWDRIEVRDATLAAVRHADAVCFGSLAQRDATSRGAIQSLVSATPAAALRIFDINLRQDFYSARVIEDSLRLANVLKISDSELPVLAGILGLGDSTARQVETVARRFNLRLVALTRGPEGGLLFSDGRWSDQRAQPVDARDTVGAGDSFTAALTVGLLGGMGLDEMNQFANEVAGYVCTCVGATPQLPGFLCDRAAMRRPTASEAPLHPRLEAQPAGARI